MANHAMRDDEVQLRRRARRRLIGAITLVTVMVVALPMVLDGEPKQSGQDIVINIPPPSTSGDFASTIVPAPVEAGAPESKAATEKAEPTEKDVSTASAEAAPQPQLLPGKAEAQPVGNVEKTTEIAAAPAKAEDAGKPASAAVVEVQPKKEVAAPEKHKEAVAKQESGPFVIQLGAFANMANAKERQSRLTALKIKFYTETVKTPTGEKLRVRAGPFAARHDAERIQVKLKNGGIQDGVIAEKKRVSGER